MHSMLMTTLLYYKLIVVHSLLRAHLLTRSILCCLSPAGFNSPEHAIEVVKLR